MNLRSLFWVACLLGWGTMIQAQELQCAVNVSAPTVGSDRQVFDQMQDAITKYMNLRKWTDLKYEPQERIRCTIQFLISDRPSIDEFKGTVQVQVIRPVFKSTYESKIVEIQDKDIFFKFVPFNPLEFNDNAYIDELTSILNYYAYMIIGFDQETFELAGGSTYFQKAQQIVNLSANQGGPGWRNMESQRNRYWLVNEMLDNSLRQIHNVFYTYHRQGLDQMEKNLSLGRTSVLNAIKELQKINQRFPAKYVVRVFLTAKSAEIIEIFRNADMRDKAVLVPIMEEIDPANASDYQAIRQEK
jgi:hypothetical protein